MDNLDELRYELAETQAELVRHHRDFAEISLIVHQAHSLILMAAIVSGGQTNTDVLLDQLCSTIDTIRMIVG